MEGARRDDLNGDQPSLLAARTEIDGSSHQLFISSFPIDLVFLFMGPVLFFGRGNVEQGATPLEFFFSVTVGEESVISDSRESAGQDMEKKTANEFRSIKSHDSLSIVLSIIPPTKGNRLVIHLDQAMIRDGDAMGVAGQVIEDLLRVSKWRLAINHPLVFPTFFQKPTERVGVRKALRLTFQLEFRFPIRLFETVKEEFAKSPGKDSDGKKEILSGSDPFLAVLGKPTARDHAMEMRVEEKILSPSVQNGGKPDLRSQVFGIGGDREKSL